MIVEDEEECPFMVLISFPRQRRPTASTYTIGTLGEPLEHINSTNDEESDKDDSESVPEAT